MKKTQEQSKDREFIKSLMPSAEDALEATEKAIAATRLTLEQRAEQTEKFCAMLDKQRVSGMMRPKPTVNNGDKVKDRDNKLYADAVRRVEIVERKK